MFVCFMKCSYSHFKPDTDNVCIIAGMRRGISHQSVAHPQTCVEIKYNEENNGDGE